MGGGSCGGCAAPGQRNYRCDIEAAIPDREGTLVLYCGGGYRSALAADAIQKMGYTKVLSLDGGWRAIVSSGLPIEN